MESHDIIKIFAETLVEIDFAKISSRNIDFKAFINDVDLFCWKALKDGDVIPSLYVNIIDQALSEISLSFKGKYKSAYKVAVKKYHVELALDRMASVASDPDYLGVCAEQSFLNNC